MARRSTRRAVQRLDGPSRVERWELSVLGLEPPRRAGGYASEAALAAGWRKWGRRLVTEREAEQEQHRLKFPDDPSGYVPVTGLYGQLRYEQGMAHADIVRKKRGPRP